MWFLKHTGEPADLSQDEPRRKKAAAGNEGAARPDKGTQETAIFPGDRIGKRTEGSA